MLINRQDPENALRPLGEGVPLDRSKVRRTHGMIYWFRWGRHDFDIRVMRKLLQLPAQHVADSFFQPDNPYFNREHDALTLVVGELRDAMKAQGVRSFAALMKRHDATDEVRS